MSGSKGTKIVIVPFLSLGNGAVAIEFYKAAFGAVELFRHDGEDGSVVCELVVGDGRFWVADESPEHKNFSPEMLGGGAWASLGDWSAELKSSARL